MTPEFISRYSTYIRFLWHIQSFRISLTAAGWQLVGGLVETEVQKALWAAKTFELHESFGIVDDMHMTMPLKK
jgi:hypothetical protein